MRARLRPSLRLAALAFLLVLAVGFAVAALHRPDGAPVQLLGRPVSVVKSLTPQDPQFGDTVVATLDVYTDAGRVDPQSIRILARFQPYAITARTRTDESRGGVTVTRFEARLRCLELVCVPPAQTAAVRFAPARVSYREGTRSATVVAPWPTLNVHSRVAQRDLVRPRFRVSQAQASSSYRLPPTVTGYSLLAASALLALGGAWLLLRVALGRGVPGRRPSALEQILAELAASTNGDSGHRRRALDELARQLQPLDESLSRESRVLAWAPQDPRPDAISDLTTRVRATVSR